MEMKKGLIIGLGNVLKGDFGVGCYILEALGRGSLGDGVELAYLGDDPRCAAGLVYGMDFVIVVSAFSLGGPVGKVYIWPYRVFKQHLSWIVAKHRVIRWLVQTLATAELARGFPTEILFIWIEPQVIEGVGLCPEVRKAMWKVVGIIKEKLVEKRLLQRENLQVSPFLSIEAIAAGTLASRKVGV